MITTLHSNTISGDYRASGNLTHGSNFLVSFGVMSTPEYIQNLRRHILLQSPTNIMNVKVVFTFNSYSRLLF